MLDRMKDYLLLGAGFALVALLVMFFNVLAREELAKSRQATAEANLATERESHDRTRDAITSQQLLADAQLKAANASVRNLQTQLDTRRAEQQATDDANGKVVAGLRADLQRLHSARRLLDQQLQAAAARGRGDGGGAGQGEPGATPAGGGRDEAHAGGVLPAAPSGPRDFEAEADDDAFDADRINVAYIACRADAIAVRAATTPQ